MEEVAETVAGMEENVETAAVMNDSAKTVAVLMEVCGLQDVREVCYLDDRDI